MDIHNKDEGFVLHGSLEAPIKVEEMRRDGRPPKYIDWEYNHIGKELVHFRKVHQSLLTNNDRMIDRIVVRRANGEMHVFYFDVTEQLAVDAAMYKAVYDELPPEARAVLDDDKAALDKISPGWRAKFEKDGHAPKS